ncbi:hypothetical protein ACOSQ4_022697 [Xanthoceras sorbifolium]
MLSPGDDLMREIDLYKGSSTSSGESTDSEPHPLASIGDCDSEDRTKLIHSSYPVKRSWKKLLSKESVRPNRLWSRMKNTESTPFPKLRNLITYAWVRHRFELFCGTQFFTPIFEAKRKFTSHLMLHLKPHIPTSKEALKERKERAAASAQKRKQPTVSAMLASPPAPTQQPAIMSSPSSEMVASKQELKKKKIDYERDAKMEELEKKVVVLAANEDRLRME